MHPLRRPTQVALAQTLGQVRPVHHHPRPERAEQPLRQFMLAQTRENELHQVLLIAKEPTTMAAADVPLDVLIPAFVLSELTTAFQIGFMLLQIGLV